MNTIKPTDNMINPYQNKTQTAKKAEKQKEQEKEVKNIKDKNQPYVKKTGGQVQADNGVYSRKTADKAKTEGISVNMLRSQNAEQLVQMIYDILSMQGRHGRIARARLEDAILGIKDYLENGGTVTPEEQAAAAAAIADGGPWGVEAVSDRLVAMAVKFADGDESKYNLMKNAIEAGFKMAEAAWGGQLPEISYKTFDATMTKLAAAFGQTAQSEAG